MRQQGNNLLFITDPEKGLLQPAKRDRLDGIADITETSPATDMMIHYWPLIPRFLVEIKRTHMQEAQVSKEP